MLLIENSGCGTSLVVPWLRLCAPNAGSVGSVPASGTKISHAMRPKKEKKKPGGVKCIITENLKISLMKLEISQHYFCLESCKVVFIFPMLFKSQIS